MSHVRSASIYYLEKVVNKIMRGLGKIKPGLSSILSILFIAPTRFGQASEDAIISFAKKISNKVNQIQKSIEESLVMSSIYIGFLLTVAIVILTVLLYVVG